MADDAERLVAAVMARCPNCGQTVTRTFCAACGTRLTPEEPGPSGSRVLASGESARSAEATSSTPSRPPVQPGRARAGRLLWLGALVVVVASGAAAVFVLSRGASTERERTAAATTVAPTAITRAAAPVENAVSPTIPAVTTPATSSSTFVVRVDCGGTVCKLSIRESPSPNSRQTGTLDDAQAIAVACVSPGELVTDADGQGSSTFWLRLADGSGYISSVYAQGPTVGLC